MQSHTAAVLKELRLEWTAELPGKLPLQLMIRRHMKACHAHQSTHSLSQASMAHMLMPAHVHITVREQERKRQQQPSGHIRRVWQIC